MLADGARRAQIGAARDRLRHQQRYGQRHKLTRRSYAPLVASGLVRCARGGDCRFAELVDGVWVGGLIEPGTPWDLGHVDGSASQYSGPEHAVCNRGAPGRNVTSRKW